MEQNVFFGSSSQIMTANTRRFWVRDRMTSYKFLILYPKGTISFLTIFALEFELGLTLASNS
jgi:hypothetical protein